MRLGRFFWFGALLAVAILLSTVAAAEPASGQAPASPAAQSNRGQAANPPAEAKKEDPAAAPVAAPVDPKTYIIGARDVLAIRIWREPEMSSSVVVRPDGKISLLLAGEVEAAGLTPAALALRVAEAYSKILTKPEVNVSVTSVQSKRYYLSGNVSQSGAVPLVTPTTILQALSSAGLGQWAKKSKIVIMRGTERIKFNYDEVIKGKKLEQNIFLQDGDHIFVP
ncbi:MAG TPA: polysaccharide biosynthesis/export family protein [Paludibaculum sp.]|jgi:polysaccharide export outer membrane protein